MARTLANDLGLKFLFVADGFFSAFYNYKRRKK